MVKYYDENSSVWKFKAFFSNNVGVFTRLRIFRSSHSFLQISSIFHFRHHHLPGKLFMVSDKALGDYAGTTLNYNYEGGIS